MLLPYGSDAPLYHLPIVTGAMILLNVLAYLGVGALEAQMNEEDFAFLANQLILQYGTFKPWQWITSNFMHAGFMHLLGNMFCLWGFGLVVEGKIGWWRFLLVYLGIGVTQCAVEQTLMLFADEGGSLGASAIIYGLMAMCMVWAPENEMNCFVLIGFRPTTMDIPLYSLGVFFVFIELLTGLIAGLTFGSQVLHLMGAGIGFGVAVVMLKKDLVDCEGWDLFNVWAGTQHKARDEQAEAAAKIVREAEARRLADLAGGRGRAVAADEARLSADDLFQTAAPLTASVDHSQVLAAMRQAIARGDPQTALACFEQIADDPFATDLPEAELLKIIALFHQQKLWSASIPALVRYLQNFQASESQIRLWLARILIQAENRPAQALSVLAKLNATLLKPEDRQLVAKLRARAQQLQAGHPPEIVQDW
jgi:membrane associated rhomboid family serine protease